MINGISRSKEHNVAAIGKLRAISMYSDKNNPDYAVYMQQYPDVAKLIANNEVPKSDGMKETLRKNIESVYKGLFPI